MTTQSPRLLRPLALGALACLSIFILLVFRPAAPPLAAAAKAAPAPKARPSKELSAARLAPIRATERERAQAAVVYAREELNDRTLLIMGDRYWTDALGNTHVVLSIRATVGRIARAPIVGVPLIVHVGPDGGTYMEDINPNFNRPETVSVTRDQAIAVAHQPGNTLLHAYLVLKPRALHLSTYSRRSTATDYVVAWEVRTQRTGDGAEIVTHVDPEEATIQSRRVEGHVDDDEPRPNSIAARAFGAAAAGTPVPTPTPTRTPTPMELAMGEGRSFYSDRIPLRMSRHPIGLYTLCDPVLGRDRDGYGTCASYAIRGSSLSLPYWSEDETWGDGQALPYGGDPRSVTGETAAVDALHGVRGAWELLRLLDPVNGPVGGTDPIRIVVHANPWVDENGEEDDDCSALAYAGDNTVSFPDCPGNPIPTTTPDIVGHEFFHLVYDWRLPWSDEQRWSETGATQEANAFILGEMTEFHLRRGDGATVPEVGGDFAVGSGLPRHGFPKSMVRPSLWGGLDYVEPGTNPGQNGETVTTNRLAGVLMRMFFFLSRGAQPYVAGDPNGETYSSRFRPDGFAGVGNDAATRIWFNAIPYFGNAWFIDVRDACLESARQLYGLGPEYVATANAFAAVGITDPYDPTPPVIELAARQVENERKVTIDVSVRDSEFQFAYLYDPLGRRIDLTRASSQLTYRVGQGDGEVPTGTYRVRVTASDFAGNAQSIAATLTVDADAPIVTLADTTQGRTLQRRFFATAADALSPLKPLEFRVDGRVVSSVAQAPYETTIDFGSSAHADGLHRIEAVARDKWGNERVALVDLPTDRSGGTCQIAGISLPRTPAQTDAVARFYHDDASGGTSFMEAWLDGTTPWHAEMAYDASGSAAAQMTFRVPVGNHRLELKCTDRFGNVTHATPRSFEVMIPPRVAITVRVDYDKVVVDWLAEATIGLASVRNELQGARQGQTTPLPTHPAQMSDTTTYWHVPPGSYNACVWATDIGGIESERVCRNVVTTARPTIPTPTPTVPTEVYHDEVEPNYDFGYQGWNANIVPGNVTAIRGVITAGDPNDAFYIPLVNGRWMFVDPVDHGSPCASDVDFKWVNSDRVPQTRESGSFNNSRGTGDRVSWHGGPLDNHIVLTVDTPQACLPYRYTLYLKRE